MNRSFNDNKVNISYWLQQYNSVVDDLDLPTDFSRQAENPYRQDHLEFIIDESITKKLRSLAKSNKSGLYGLIYAAFTIYIAKLSQKTDLVIGAFQDSEGFSNNVLPVRRYMEVDQSFDDFLTDTDESLISSFDHQGVTMDALHEAMEDSDEIYSFPSISVAFSLNEGTKDFAYSDQHTSSSSTNSSFTRQSIDLVLEIQNQGSDLQGRWLFNGALFSKETLQNRSEAFIQILSSIAQDCTILIKNIDIVSNSEQSFLTKWNDRARNIKTLKPVNERFNVAVENHPDHIAIEYKDKKITYRDAQTRVYQIAQKLLNQGAKHGSLVAIYLNRDIDLPLTMLAVMQIGCAYVPLDPLQPVSRLTDILQEAQVDNIVTKQVLPKYFDILPGQCVDISKLESISDVKLKKTKVSLSDTAYVIYTSGSTGKPKGVSIPHLGLSNILRSFQNEPGFSDDDKLLAVTTAAFDIAALELFLPLVTGATVCIADENTAQDPEKLNGLLSKHEITVLQCVPTTWRLLLNFGGPLPDNLRGWCGGEALPSDLAAMAVKGVKEFWNVYGPTETTIWSTINKVSVEDCSSLKKPVSIGYPIDNTKVYILDEHQQKLPMGIAGTLWIGGAGVANEYYKRPDITVERFQTNPFDSSKNNNVIYDTGDIARITTDGLLEYVGRKDFQVKIRGFRIELGDIETKLTAINGIDNAVISACGDTPDSQRLVAYYTLTNSGKSVNVSDLRDELFEQLPDYMVPSHYILLEDFPLNVNGKIDRKALPSPDNHRPDLSVEFIEANSLTEKQLAAIWSEQLSLDQVGIDDNFFELGGTSLLAMQSMTALKKKHNIDLSIVKIFEFQTIRGIAEYIDSGDALNRDHIEQPKPTTPSSINEPIAVVGMACRFPDAKNIDEYWQNLLDGKHSIKKFTAEEMGEQYSHLLNQKHYVPARGVVDGAEYFDHKFFGMSPKEAETIDPQQRLLLQEALHALEDSGIVVNDSSHTVGVFAGTSNNTYNQRLIQKETDVVENFGELNVSIMNEKDYVATRISHKLNLTGPSLNVQTACSTALVAIHQATQSLRLHECDVALAGSATINAPLNNGYEYNEGGIYSSDGYCKPFSSESSGTVFSDGVGVVTLRRLSDAKRDGDRIYAVIKGTAINNDGANKMSFSAPSVKGQVNVVAASQRNANVESDGIDYIEAHGTGTPLGDPIEVEALTAAFNRTKILPEKSCALGSAKSNFGHLNAAAGIAGFIKSALSLYHGKVPATIHYEKPNPQIDFSKTPFFVVNKCWPLPERDRPRRIGVTALGIGGTNAHLILEESTSMPSTEQITSDRSSLGDYHLLMLSAKDSNALLRQAQQLSEYIEGNNVRLNDVAFTLQNGRQHWNERQAVVVKKDQIVQRLSKPSPVYSVKKSVAIKPVRVGLMFPGQGAQHPNMGIALYDWHPVYRSAIDECHAILLRTHKIDLKASLYPEPKNLDATVEMLNQTQFTQPAIFATSYATAKLLLSLGIEPELMLGHSVGEFVAAHFSNVFTLDEALHLVATRGAMMQALPTGSMLSVRLDEKELSEKLVEGSVIATINGPDNCVAAGPDDAISLLKTTLEKADVSCRSLLTSHAFHSPMMDPIVEPFADIVKQCSLGEPTKPIMSTVTGQWLTKEQAKDPMYWACHLREPVRFFDAVSALWQEQEIELIECGPRATCTTLAKTSHAWLLKNLTNNWLGKNSSAYSTLGNKGEQSSEIPSFLLTLGHLWTNGINIDGEALFVDHAKKVSLPGYPFAENIHWVKTHKNPDAMRTVTPNAISNEQLGHNIQETLQSVIPKTTNNHLTLTTASAEQNIPGSIIMSSRTDLILDKMADVLEKTSGIEIKDYPSDTDFIDIGLDSLLLTEAALNIRKTFNVELSFRQLLQEFSSPQLLAEHLDTELPASEFAPVVSTAAAVTSAPMNSQAATIAQPSINMSVSPIGTNVDPNDANQVIAQQIQLMQQQLQMLSGQVTNSQSAGIQSMAVQPASSVANTSSVSETKKEMPVCNASKKPKQENKKVFGAQAKIERNKTAAFTPKQQKAYDSFRDAYIARTPKSRAMTEEYRPYLADPRVVTGFNPDIKDLVYNVVSEKSEGALIWDIDGNEYIDLTGGFGCHYMGHRHPVVVEAVKRQMDEGYEIGPLHRLAGKVAKHLCQLTGMERAAFCNTGSEAVMGAMRIARTITGKSKIVTFSNDYHGIFDEVIARSSQNGRVFPAASGILPESVTGNMIVPYGDMNGLQTIRDNIDDIAAILIEPIQSRNPLNQPKDFVKALREIATEADIPMIFDEIITGFRMGMGGAQEFYGVKADIATYGKVIGGGMPIGAIAGKAKYMDALDGGQWEYGDDSVPEVGVTYFAGTFVRHPLALAAAEATLKYLEKNGKKDLARTNEQTLSLVTKLNEHFKAHEMPINVVHFASLFRVEIDMPEPIPSLYYYRLLYNGLHVWLGRNLFLSVAHTDEHFKIIFDTFVKVADEMVAASFLPGRQSMNDESNKTSNGTVHNTPPVPGAKLGKDPEGNPAWFIPDPDKQGAFKKVGNA